MTFPAACRPLPPRFGRRLALAGVAVLLAGCDGETAPAPVAPATVQPSPAGAQNPKPPAPADRRSAVTVDAGGRKWLTPQVPYDVFPELPDAEAIIAGAGEVPSEPVAVSPAPAETMVASTAPSAVTETPMASSSGTPTTPGDGVAATEDWAAVLPLDVLQNEIAAVRNSLGERLVTVGSYNAGVEAVQKDGWLISALATIAGEHPAPISWKSNALLARDAGVAVATAATGPGRQNFTAAGTAFQNLAGVLDNNPPDLAKPDPAASREETADRASLMARMETAQNALKEAAANQAALAAAKDAARREASLLAALAKFTAHADYTSADEPDYQAAAGTIVTAGAAMMQAAEAEDHSGFTAALDQVGTACANCHAKYRFGN